MRLCAAAQARWAELGSAVRAVSRNISESRNSPHRYDVTKRYPDVVCLHSTVVLSHPLTGMLISHAFAGRHPTGVALSLRRSQLVLHRRARCCFRSGAVDIVCSAKRPPIKLIATDVDGTLLNSKQELTPAVEQAIKKAADLGVPVILCLLNNVHCRKGALSPLHIDVDASFNKFCTDAACRGHRESPWMRMDR